MIVSSCCGAPCERDGRRTVPGEYVDGVPRQVDRWVCSACSCECDAWTEDPQRSGRHIDVLTGCRPVWEWGGSSRVGFVSDSRFGSGQVIPRTNRETTRKWRRANGA